MNKENIKTTFTELIEKLKMSINNLKTKKEKISQELKKYHTKTTIEELEKTLPMILQKIQK